MKAKVYFILLVPFGSALISSCTPDGGAFKTPHVNPPSVNEQDSGVPERVLIDLGAYTAEKLGGLDLPSLFVSVGDGEGSLGVGASGLRRVGDTTPVRASDKMHIGSCTKAMTATLAATLVDDGLLSWQATLSALFPNIAVHPDYVTKRVADLLAHRAGVIGNPMSAGEPALWSEMWNTNDTDRSMRTQIAEELLTKPAPETAGVYTYSNASFILAGAVIERIADDSWENLMQERLFDPLGMDSCGFGVPDVSGNLSQPWGHDGDGPYIPINEDNPSSLGPAGTVHCSLEDWGKFAALHIRGEKGTSLLISPETMQAMHEAPGDYDYGYGWGIVSRSWANGLALGHSGSNTNFKAVLWVAPNIDRYFMVATNAAPSNSGELMDDVIGDLISAYAQ